MQSTEKKIVLSPGQSYEVLTALFDADDLFDKTTGMWNLAFIRSIVDYSYPFSLDQESDTINLAYTLDDLKKIFAVSPLPTQPICLTNFQMETIIALRASITDHAIMTRQDIVADEKLIAWVQGVKNRVALIEECMPILAEFMNQVEARTYVVEQGINDPRTELLFDYYYLKLGLESARFYIKNLGL